MKLQNASEGVSAIYKKYRYNGKLNSGLEWLIWYNSKCVDEQFIPKVLFIFQAHFILCLSKPTLTVYCM